MFPLGSMTKDRVREIAAERGFAVAAKPDSHDICFIPDGDTRGFLARQLGSRPGPVVDAATGATVGRARRHLRLHRRAAQGARRRRRRPAPALRARHRAGDPHGDDRHAGPGRASARCAPARRPGPVPAPELPFAAAGAAAGARARRCACEVAAGDDGGLRIALAEEQRGVAPGQSAVLYEPDAERGDRVLGQAAVQTARERDETVRH